MPNIEEEIDKLHPEVSKIYYDARAHLIEARHSNTERFSTAASIVRAFWKALTR